MVAPNVTGTPTSAGGGFGDATVTYPTGDVAGEIFLTYVIAYAYGTLGTFSATGHTELGTHTWTGPLDGSEWRISWFGRIRDGTEGTTFTMTQSQSMYMNVICMRVADADVSGTITNAVDAGTASNTNRGTTIAMAAVTTVTADATAFAGATPYDHSLNSNPSGWTLEHSALAQRVWSKEMATAGSTGTDTAGLSSTDDAMAITVAIKPAATAVVETVDTTVTATTDTDDEQTWIDTVDTNITAATSTVDLASYSPETVDTTVTATTSTVDLASLLDLVDTLITVTTSTTDQVLARDLEGFRFYFDNATEGGDPVAAQDVNITQPAGVLIGVRILADFEGDPGDEVPKLQSRLLPSGTWVDVEVP